MKSSDAADRAQSERMASSLFAKLKNLFKNNGQSGDSRYVNPPNYGYQLTLNSEIFVDKTGMIAPLNQVIRTESRYVCITRPRRFGKTVAAKMLAAYYSRGCDSKNLFSRLAISKDLIPDSSQQVQCHRCQHAGISLQDS